MAIIEILASIFGVLMSLAHFPQAYKIFKNKSSKTTSQLAYWIFSLGATVWVIYGIYLNNWTIFWSFIFGFIGSWLVLILTYAYKK